MAPNQFINDESHAQSVNAAERDLYNIDYQCFVTLKNSLLSCGSRVRIASGSRKARTPRSKTVASDVIKGTKLA